MVRAASFRRAFAVLFIAALMLSVLATAALAVEYPSKPNSYVADYANVLTAAERSQLEAILNDVQTKTTCEVAFVTLKDVGNVTVEEYRVKLFENWGIGKAGKDNGLLVLLVTGSRDIQVEVGYGLEPIITDATVGSYLDQYAVPSLSQNKYGEGLISLANAFSQRLISKYDPANPPTSSGTVGGGAVSSLSPVAAFSLVVVPFALIIGGIVFAARAFAPKCPVCKSRVHVRDRVITPATTLIAGKGMRISTCPKCGHVNEREYPIPRIIPVIIPPRGGRGGGGFGGFGGGFGGGKGGGFGGFGGFGGGRSGGGGGGRKF